MAIKTKKAILNTFQEMLEEMPFDKITVTELTKRAEISHNTFYYHYEDIYELLRDWLQQVLQPYFAAADSIEAWEDVTKRVLRLAAGHPRIVYHLLNSLSREQMENYFFQRTEDIFHETILARADANSLTEKQIGEIADFCRYAYLGFLLRFVWNRMNADVDKTVSDLSRLFEIFIDNAIRDTAQQNLGSSSKM